MFKRRRYFLFFEVNMLSESQKAHARKISIIEGSFATVWGAFTGGFGGNSYLVGFFLWLGATPFLMSIYGALIPLASVIQPFSLMIAHTFTSKKRFDVCHRFYLWSAGCLRTEDSG